MRNVWFPLPVTTDVCHCRQGSHGARYPKTYGQGDKLTEIIEELKGAALAVQERVVGIEQRPLVTIDAVPIARFEVAIVVVWNSPVLRHTGLLWDDATDRLRPRGPYTARLGQQRERRDLLLQALARHHK